MAAAAGPKERALPPSGSLRGGADCCAGEFPRARPRDSGQELLFPVTMVVLLFESEAIHCAGAVADHLHAKRLRHRQGGPRPGSWWAPGGASRRSAPAWRRRLDDHGRLLELEEVLLGNARRRTLDLSSWLRSTSESVPTLRARSSFSASARDTQRDGAHHLGLGFVRLDSCAMASTSTFSSTVMLTRVAVPPLTVPAARSTSRPRSCREGRSRRRRPRR